MRNLFLSALAVSTIVAAAPATAQSWRLQPAIQRQIQTDINQLQNRIQRAAQRGTVSRREANGLRREANAVQRMHNRYARNGLNRQEVAELEVAVNRLHQRLRLERRDWDGRRG